MSMRTSLKMIQILDIAESGRPVLPIEPGGKAPLFIEGVCENGVYSATLDPELIRWVWTEHPQARVACPILDGFFDVDVDKQNDGWPTIIGLESQHGELPNTTTVKTPNGGVHATFRGEGPFRGKIGKGVDIKSPGGYVLVPPSEGYEWVDISPIAYAPAWLLKLARKSGAAGAEPNRWNVPTAYGGPSDGSGLIRTVESAPAGERNSLLFWAACRAAETGILEQIRTELEQAAATAGLDMYEITRTIASAEKRVSK